MRKEARAKGIRIDFLTEGWNDTIAELPKEGNDSIWGPMNSRDEDENKETRGIVGGQQFDRQFTQWSSSGSSFDSSVRLEND